MRGLFVRRLRGRAVRRAVLVIPTIVACGFFLDDVTRSADAADSTHTAGGLASSSVTATPDPATSDATPTTTATTAVATTTATTTTAVTTTTTAPTNAAAAPTTAAPDAVGIAAASEAAVATTLPPPTNQSTCRSDLPGAVMTITMADISYECAVYPGGQSVIDAGVATVITAEESPLALATGPGDAGTLWITGHRVSHGGPFAAVPDLADGAIITVSDATATASYVIVGRAYVEIRDGLAVDATGQATEAATLDAVLRTDRNADLSRRLLVQTCDAEDFRWMIYADLVTA
jgi:sortase (surface protein transpeptidase)